MVCFYDASMRKPPETLEEFYETEHLNVRFMEGRTSLVVLASSGLDKTRIRRPLVTVSNFNAIPPFVKGSRLLATQMNLMQLKTLKCLDVAPLHFETDPVTVYMVWHERSISDPAHIWLRHRIQRIANEVASRMSAIEEQLL